MGTVTSVIEVPASEEERQELLDNYDPSVDGEYNFVSSYRYSTHVVSLDIGEDKLLMCFINTDFAKIPETGECISLIGEHFTYDGDEYVAAEYSPIYTFE